MTHTPQRPPLPNPLLHRAAPALNGFARRAPSLSRDASVAASLGVTAAPGEEEEREDDPVHILLKARLAQTEPVIAALFGTDGQRARIARPSPSGHHEAARPEDSAKPSAAPKKAARTIVDDYGCTAQWIGRAYCPISFARRPPSYSSDEYKYIFGSGEELGGCAQATGRREEGGGRECQAGFPDDVLHFRK
jgi:hypothetical protein